MELGNFINPLGIDYAICGGYAIDLFIGKKTRSHKDIDVAVYTKDRDKIIKFMLNNNWSVFEPCGTDFLHKINAINDQKRIKSNIWCIKENNQHYKFTEKRNGMFSIEFDNFEQNKLDYIEFLFNKCCNDYFYYSRNNDIKIKLDSCIMKSNNIPFLAPELVLLYKSTASDETEYTLDFNNSIKKMNINQLMWLKNSLKIMFPNGHIWLNDL